MVTPYGIKTLIGFTFIYSKNVKDGMASRPVLTEKFSMNWAIAYEVPKYFLAIDYTGNLYGSMRLPLLGPLDPRDEFSKPWSIQNIQFTYKKFQNLEIYVGIKNILNWTPNKGNSFIIARAEDPFDKNVEYDENKNVLPSASNPYALTFDPSYVYAPNQGIRFFLGMRYRLD